MENNSEESVTPELNAEPSDELSFHLLKPDISAYVQKKSMSANTKLFSMLALLNAYVPGSYLSMEECQQILGPLEPITGEPPFEERMQPFSSIIRVSSQGVLLKHPDVAKRCLELLADLNIDTNAIVQDCIVVLCGNKASPHTVHFLQSLLFSTILFPVSKEVSLFLIKKTMGKENSSYMKLPKKTTESSSDKTVTLNIKLFSNFFFCLFKPDILEYVEKHRDSTTTRLFSILALLRAYVPKSYLLINECQQILKTPCRVGEGFSFEKRMVPFLSLIRPSPSRVSLINPEIANRSMELLADLGISRSSIADDCIVLFCEEKAPPRIVQLIKDLLTQRKMGEGGKEQFSPLIEDLCNKEGYSEAISVLMKASMTFEDKFIYPQTIARLYYQKDISYVEAEAWALEAIDRDPTNSYPADTLGQVYKNWLRKKVSSLAEVNLMARKAIGAFKEEEEKAENELDFKLSKCDDLPDFNNRGTFGFIQVAKIISGKYKLFNQFKKTLKFEVKASFKFFEWYLNYSKLNRNTVEPDYFWRDVASCYKAYTSEEAADSTSFPALLDCLNHGLFVSKERRAFKSEVTEKTQSDLEQTRDKLKIIYEKNVDDVEGAERYILSNIILSQKVPHSSQHPPVKELQSILQRILSTGVQDGDPEFYLLVLLLFWPEEKLQTGQERDNKEPNTDEDQLQDQTMEEANINEEDTGEDSEQQSPGLKFDLEQYVTLMEQAYDNVYSKYLQGRYLLPLFFLGKGSELSRWIHKSRLDAVVERNVDTELGNDPKRNKMKRRKINDMWKSGKVWQLQKIQNMLQPMQIETFKMQQSGKEAEVIVCVGGKKITARIDCKSARLAVRSGHFYLGFNIRGPIVFKAP